MTPSRNTDELIETLTRGLSGESPRRKRTGLAWAWALVPILVATLAVARIGLRADLRAGHPVAGYWPYVCGLAVLAACGSLLAWVSAIPGRRAPRWLVFPLVLAGLSTALGIGQMAHEALSSESLSDGLGLWGARCAISEAAIAALPAVVFFALFRKLAPTRPPFTGSLGLFALGALSALALALHCPSDNPVHVLLWHFVPVALMTGLGALLARRFLRW